MESSCSYWIASRVKRVVCDIDTTLILDRAAVAANVKTCSRRADGCNKLVERHLSKLSAICNTIVMQ